MSKLHLYSITGAILISFSITVFGINTNTINDDLGNNLDTARL